MRQTSVSPENPSATVAPAHAEARASDAAVIDLLRLRESMEVGDLARALSVTATAVRQRLDRLMRGGLVERSTVSKPRGRPSHAYSLTEAGHRIGGDNFRDLALVLWQEIRDIRSPEVRSGLLGRIGAALANTCRERIQGNSPAERLKSVAGLMQERQISCSVNLESEAGGLPVLTSHTCPYPDLAERDRGICAAERVMLQELVGTSVRLADCRLDGGSVCRFVTGQPSGGEVGEGTCTSDS